MTALRLVLALLAVTATSACGCSSISNSGTGGFASLLNSESRQREEERHRSRYQEERSPADLNWLMRNCVESGMTPSEINGVLGEHGQRVYDDDWIKNRGGHYHAGDDTWKWGPDREGNSVYLVFRGNKLVNFDPNEFASTPFED